MILKIDKRKISLIFSLPLLFMLLSGLNINVSAITWSDFEIRLTVHENFDGMPSVLETSDGTLWIFWSRSLGKGRYDILYVTSTDFGASWSEETPLIENADANTGVSAFQASDGTIWLVWASDRTGNYEIFYKTSSDLGASWSNDTQLTFYSGYDLKPTIYQMSDDSIWILWSSDRSGRYDIYLKISYDNGVSWSDAIRLTTDPYLDKFPSILQASDGTIWLVWASDRTGNYEIFYKTSSDLGASWSNDTQLTRSTKIDTNPFIFQTIDEKIWIFWSFREPSETANDDICYIVSGDYGNSWSDIVQFTTDKYDDIWVSAYQASDVKIWVVWTSDRAGQPDTGNWDIYYKVSLVGDVNEDGVVDILDMSIVSKSFGMFEGEPGYNSDADINVDGIIDLYDLILVSQNLGAT